jgi:hypothetical protein
MGWRCWQIKHFAVCILVSTERVESVGVIVPSSIGSGQYRSDWSDESAHYSLGETEVGSPGVKMGDFAGTPSNLQKDRVDRNPIQQQHQAHGRRLRQNSQDISVPLEKLFPQL